MQLKTRTWCLISLLLFVAAILFWLYGNKYQATRNQAPVPARPGVTTNASALRRPAPFPLLSTSTALPRASVPPLQRFNASTLQPPGAAPHPEDKSFPHRLRNTARSLEELMRSDTAILLRNAFIDTASPSPLNIPDALRAEGDPGAYIIQSHRPIDERFRARLAAARAEIISYIPNNAYLVRMSRGMAMRLASAPETQSVLPFEPYYKLDRHLLKLAVENEPLPDGGWLRVTAYPGERDGALQSLVDLGSELVGEERTPFGPQLIVRPAPGSLTLIARVPTIQGVERFRPRVLANDRTRVRVGVSADSLVASNYLGLTGSGVTVNVNDSGVDAAHPNLQGRVSSPEPTMLQDPIGHGTFVSSVIAGSGSSPIPATPSGSDTNANFRGMAPGARIFALPFAFSNPDPGDWIEDAFLQRQGALTNYVLRGRQNVPLISNNSWVYDGDNDYTFLAALWDAAARDAVPELTNAQPVLYVFGSGNAGDSDSDNGTGGTSDSIPAPASAKNVLTVGAVESLRNITNSVITTNIFGVPETNAPFLAVTDSDFEVAAFSSRGNVGIATEGIFGRFKPDVVAPGVFLVGARSKEYRDPTDLSDDRTRIINDLNQPLKPHYRYETGTSFSAPVASGMLALMQEFFEQRAPTASRRTNSPAMMKALLINGARSLGGVYDLDTSSPINYQGWGLVNLTNSIPEMLPGQPEAAWPYFLVDQSPTNALATGETRSWDVTLNTNALSAGFRVTLVWTDPPGNPNAAIKLVNDLDLIVSNIVTGVTSYGNNIPAQSDFNVPVSTNSPFATDKVNNVENVFLREADATNFVVTVAARRVNVNAVNDIFQTTGRTNDIVQDFALVIALGDVTVTNGLSVRRAASGPLALPPPLTLTNGVPVRGQRVGANPVLAGGTNGLAPQWNFYVFTNVFFTNEFSSLTNGTNIAFIIFEPPNLSRSRVSNADLDLFVSTDPGLLDLNPTALAGALRSVGRRGAESIVLTNGVLGAVYYAAVKAEDQQGGEYGFVALSSNLPFDEGDGERRRLNGFPVNAPIPDGTANDPGIVQIFAVGITPELAQRVVAEFTLTHQNTGDLIGILNHEDISVVLNNHNLYGGVFDVTNTVFRFDDSAQGPLTGARSTDGPGQLTDYAGTSISGVWIFNMIDNSPTHTGVVQQLTLEIDPLVFGDNLADLGDVGLDFELGPFGEASGVQEVPPGVTNLILRLRVDGPVDVSIRRGALPTTNIFDKSIRINPPGGNLTLSIFDNPPLVAGRYFFTVRNPNNSFIRGNAALFLQFDVNLETERTFGATNTPLAILDSSTITSSIFVPVDKQVADLEVGVTLRHPRPSDLVLHLTSPQGTRLLLMENRGANVQAATSSTNSSFLVFTENTNRVNPLLPVKFAAAPSTNSLSATNHTFSDSFERSPPGSYSAGQTASGWEVTSGRVNLRDASSGITPPNGTQYLEFAPVSNAPSAIRRSIPTLASNVVSVTYSLTFATRRNPADTRTNGLQNLEVAFGSFTNVTFSDVTISSTSSDNGIRGPFFLPFTNGVVSRLFSVTGTNWTTTTLNFTLRGAPITGLPTNTLVGFRSATAFGPLLDAIDLSVQTITALGTYVQPEEPFAIFKSERAYGDWKLEVSDTKLGPVPSNVAASLAGWTLHLVYADPFPKAVALTNGFPVSGSLTNSQTNYFVIDVCADTRIAFATLRGPPDSLRLLASRAGFPTGNRETDEFEPIPNTVSAGGEGLAVFNLNLSRFFPAPLKAPGRLYFAVHNNITPLTASQTNAYSLSVTVDPASCHQPRPIIRLANRIPYTNAIPPVESLFDYYVFRVSPIAEKLEFELTPFNGDLGLVAKPDLPLPTRTNAPYASDQPGIVPEIITITGSSTNPITPGDWYIGVYNRGTNAAAYTIRATQTLNTNFTIIPLTNAAPLDITFAPGTRLTNFFLFSVTNDVPEIRFDVTNLSGPASLLTGRDRLPPYSGSLISESVTGAPITVTLVPPAFGVSNLNADFYLAVVPGEITNALSFTITATIVLPPPPTNSTNNILVPVDVTFTNGQVCLSWNSQAGAQYLIQSATNVTDLGLNGNVQTIRGPLTGTGGRMTECVDPATLTPTAPLYFFQVVQLGTSPPPPTTNSLVPIDIVFTNNQVCVSWDSRLGAQYTVQSATNVTDLDLNGNVQDLRGPLNGTGARMTECFVITNLPPAPLRFFQVLEAGATTNQPPPVTTNSLVPITVVSTNGQVCLSWSSKTGAQYQVQSATNVLDLGLNGNAQTIRGPLNGTGSRMTECFVLTNLPPAPFRFFQVVELATTTTNQPPPVTTNSLVAVTVVSTNGQVCLSWSSLTGAQYRVQSATNVTDLGLNGNVQTIRGPLTGTGSQMTECFVLTNLPPAPLRFFQVVQAGTSTTPTNQPPPASTNFVSSGVSVSATTNQVCVSWPATVGSTYYLQGTVDLVPATWTNASPALTATRTNESFCIALPTPYRFFRVALGAASGSVTNTNAAPVQISGPVISTNGGFEFRWPAVIGQTYRVQYATNVPPTWLTLTNLTATANPMLFRDASPLTNSPARFYRVVQP